MPVSQLPQAPFRQDRKIFPTPIIGDVLFSEIRDCNRGNPFPEYGSPYPNANKWPDHKLVYIKPVDIERNEIFEFFYAAERENQDLYNFAFGLRNIGNREFRTVTRTYVTLRENFAPTDIEFGTAMPNVPEDKFEGVNYVFYDKEQQNTQQEELNALFVIEAHSYVEEAVLDEVLTLSTEKQDPLPPKFRVLSPTTTTDELAEGSVEVPTLTGDQLAATEDQINTNLKRKRTVSRSSAENVSSLSGKQVTNDLQVADVVETIVPDGTTIETSELTVDGSVESLGNGQSIQRVITAPELFTAKSYSTQRPDPTPEVFRVLIPTESTEENEAGTAEMPELTTGELEATEQQVNVHVKRKRKTRRDPASLPKSLTQKSTTNEKQVATVTQTLQVGDTNQDASATVDIQSEALGDGTYVVRKVEVPELFDAKLHTIQKPDIVPEKFRSTIPTTTFQTTKIGQASPPVLASGELERSEQQLNTFVYREQITERNITGDVSLPQVQKAYVEGTIAKVDEKLSSSPAIESGLLVAQSEATPIGDDKFVVQTVKVDSWPELKGSEWDYLLNTQVVSTQQMVVPPTTFNEPNTSYRAVNEDRSLKVVEEAPTDALNSYLVSLPTRTDMQLPAVLKSIEAVWVSDTAISDGDSQGTGVMPSGGGSSLQAQASSTGSAKQSAVPSIKTEIENVIGSDISATAYFFYYDAGNGSMNETNLVNRLSTLIGQSVNVWPIFKAKSHTIVTRGGSVSAATKASADQTNVITIDGATGNAQSSGEEFSWAIDRSVDVINLGPTIHAALNIADANQYTGISATSSARASLTGDFDVTASTSYTANAQVSIVPTSFPATSPADIPRSGLYIVSSKAEPFKWGWVKCFALVVDANKFAS
jgi:hypothetical protein